MRELVLLEVDAYYRDGAEERQQATLASGQGRENWTHNERVTAVDAPIGEVTHIRATLGPDYDATRETYDTGWISVSDGYPNGYVDLAVNFWRRDSTSGKVSYDLTLDIAGAAQVNGPCESWCSWRVDAYYRDGTTDDLAYTLGSGGLRSAWSHSESLTATDATLSEVTHLKATLEPDYDDTRDTYVEWIPVSDYIYKDHDMAASGDVVDPSVPSLTLLYNERPS